MNEQNVRAQRDPARRLIGVTLDRDSIARSGPDVEHERSIAIYDLIEDNWFCPNDQPEGPYHLHLSIMENRLVMDIRNASSEPMVVHILSLTPFRKIVKDYFFICDSYYAAIKNCTPSQIEAIDMGRRGLHNEGAELLRERLASKVAIDFDTARRLFTLLAVLHLKGK